MSTSCRALGFGWLLVAAGWPLLAGAQPIDVRPGPAGSFPFGLAATSGTDHVFFYADDGEAGLEVWRSDGTAVGTRRMSDTPGEAPLPIDGSILTGTRRAFYTVRAPGGLELWTATSDAAAASLVRAFEASGLGLSNRSGRMIGDRLFLISPDDRNLWVSDGTAQGTRALLPPGHEVDHLSPPLGERMLFPVRTPDASLPRLWSSDGTAAGTMEVRTPSDGPIAVRSLTGIDWLGRRVVLRQNADAQEIWASDGTTAGTSVHFRSTCDLHLGQVGGASFFVREICGDVMTLYRLAANGDAFAVWSGPPGLVLFLHGPDTANVDSDRFYFFIRRSGENKLMVVDDGADTARVVRDFGTTRIDDERSVVVGGNLLFETASGPGGLWSSDGTAAGTVPLGLDRLGDPLWPQQLGDRTYFLASDNAGRSGLWRSDGTPHGTYLVLDARLFGGSVAPDRLALGHERAFFVATAAGLGREPWSVPLASFETVPMALRPDDRFEVRVRWAKPDGETGFGTPDRQTTDTGLFWFFRESNLELMIKILDGRSNNGHFWVFYGALSNVAYEVTVIDRETGAVKVYDNPPGTFASVGDTQAFAVPGGAGLPVGQGALEAPVETLAAMFAGDLPAGPETRSNPIPPGCTTTIEVLCLQQARFSVSVDWEKPDGETGTGTAVPLTADTGLFWFFRESNLELMVKVLDGRSNNGHFWVFYGALSNVRYTLTVTDTLTGAVRTYQNPAGDFASVGDTQAFAVP